MFVLIIGFICSLPAILTLLAIKSPVVREQGGKVATGVGKHAVSKIIEIAFKLPRK